MKKLLIGAAMATIASTGAAFAETTVCLITKTDTNPFFVKMKEGAEAKAAELGMTLKSFAGKIDGDHETQVQAIETCILDGAKGILITASDTSSIVPAVQQARDAGLVVIALDTPLSPIDSADATFATDNFLAGELIGKWAAGQIGDTSSALIGMMNINVSQPTVGVLRNQGFLQGFGIDLADPAKWGDESDPRIVNNEVTNANEEGGRKSMENLLTMNAGVNVLYTINEPAAAGAHETLKDFGKVEDVIVVSVDGGCPGVQAVAEGAIGATSQQYPLLMAALGVEAIKAWADEGKKPELTPGKGFFDTGVALVTDSPVEGVPSISSEEGLRLCWG
ncbi:MAG: fructose transport system substrate-binding protein [Parvibaculaceae bacterium]|jgi:fructose transport system substrate-binding protein|tara:strand:+ start:2450 stop:3457 length:1008 start_codon:yes stop_codon:yes gene_type:complete